MDLRTRIFLSNTLRYQTMGISICIGVRGHNMEPLRKAVICSPLILGKCMTPSSGPTWFPMRHGHAQCDSQTCSCSSLKRSNSQQPHINLIPLDLAFEHTPVDTTSIFWQGLSRRWRTGIGSWPGPTQRHCLYAGHNWKQDGNRGFRSQRGSRRHADIALSVRGSSQMQSDAGKSTRSSSESVAIRSDSSQVWVRPGEEVV